MDIKTAFGLALKAARKAKGVPQEGFSDVSSRTYISSLERGVYSVTLEKIEDIASVLKLHPFALIAQAYCKKENMSLEELIDEIKNDRCL